MMLQNKASDMAMSMSLFLNFHKQGCPMIHNHCNYTFLVFVKVLKDLVNNREITLCILQFKFPLIYLCKMPDRAI